MIFSSCGNKKEPSKSGFGQINEASTSSQSTKKKKSAVKTENNTPAKNADIQIPDKQIAKAKELIESIDRKKLKSIDARKLFKNYCATCHGLRGNMEFNGSKDLSKTNTSIEERVAQVYFGKGTMTPFKGRLDDIEIVAVSEYLDQLRK